MSKSFPRPSPALVISIIALFVALGGTVYAASKINGKTIKVKSLPGNRLKNDAVTGAQVKESTLGKVPNSAHADSADSAVSAATIAGHGASCPAGTVLFNGACWETKPRVKADATVASDVCASVGGALPEALELRAFKKQTGVALGATNEYTSDLLRVIAPEEFLVAVVSNEAKINAEVSGVGDPHEYRCVIPLVR
jgi:hypothetical protein